MTDSPAASATAVLYNGLSTELLVGYASEETGALHTVQFHETRADLGEVEVLLRLEWSRKAPPGASLVLPEAGHPLAALDEYWMMWRDGDGLMVQSARHGEPLCSTVADDEWLIDRPLVTANQELHAYAWREGLLIRHRFAAKQFNEPIARVDTILDLGARPARSLCVPLPGDDGGTAVIGCVAESEGGIQASMLYVRGAKTMRLDGQTEGRYRLMGRHRMGLHAGRKARPALAVLAQLREDDSYALLEARFDFGKKECVWKRTNLEAIAPRGLESAAVYYYKTQDSPEPFIFAVGRDGHLISPGRRTVQMVRENVGTGYGYPVLTTQANRYEAVGTGSEISLRRL